MTAVPTFDRDPSWPTTTAELTDGERFLVGSLRRWALGLSDNNADHWRFVDYEFVDRLGAEDGKTALASFAAMIGALQVHARRPLRHHHPCCPCVGLDEIGIVTLIAACQRQETAMAGDLATWLIERRGAERVLQTGASLAALLRVHAVDVPLRVRAPAHGAWGPSTALLRNAAR